ncbi:MAG: YkvA family protein [Gammaproteobacteria bacterium]
MSLRVTFDLSDKDLRHFRRIMRESRAGAKEMADEEVISAAETLLTSVREQSVSDFVNQRLEKLAVMIDMLRDEEWQIPKKEHARVISALSYFAEEEDLIPDHIPVLGFLDDAIMIELVVRELRHEIEAYEDFCAFRKEETKRPKSEQDDEARLARLAKRRTALHERMRRRGRRQRRTRRGSGGPRLSLF